MKATRRMGLVAGGAALLGAVGFVAPGAYASAADDDVAVSNTETVQVLMDAAGKIASQRVYDQLVLTGRGSVDIANPVSTEGLRNLDDFGYFEVSDGAVRVKSDVSGVEKFRSVSAFTEKLPLKLEVTYALDGKKVEPGDVVGKSGTLEVRYRVTNTTAIEEDVVFDDGTGAQQTSRERVVIPMVGSLTTTLPSSFTKVSSDEANAAGDGRGGTKLSFTMTLIQPIGKAFASFGYTAQIKDGVVPKASMTALPVDPLQSPSFKRGADSYKGGAESGQDLTAGATEIDANVLKLRDGASDLVAGILKLQDGAGQLSAGLNGEAAPGARKLANGADKLDDGASKLSTGIGQLDDGANDLDQGANDLSDGLKTAQSSAPALLQGIDDLSDGAQLVDNGLEQLKGAVNSGVGTPASGPSTLRGGVATIKAGITGSLISGVDAAINALDGLKALVDASTATAAEKATIKGTLDAVINGLTNGKGLVNSQLVPGLNNLDAGLVSLNSQVAAGIGTPAAGGTLRNGVAQLIGGLGQLKAGGLDLVDGLGQLADGADLLAAGTGDLTAGTSKLDTGAGTLANGTGRLSAGASRLSTGLGDAASGSGRLADGLNQAAEAAPALPEGAGRLSKEGTSKLVEEGNSTAMDYGLKYALIAAGAERAGAAQPYGSPEGATALTAYTYELAGAYGADSANLKRGLGALAVLAACAGLAGIRRFLA